MATYRNPANGYEETADLAWLWVLLAGPAYFAIKGIWTHTAASLLLAFATAGLSWLVYPFFADQIVRTHYLRMGWIPNTPPASATPAAPPRRPNWGLAIFLLVIVVGITSGLYIIASMHIRLI